MTSTVRPRNLPRFSTLNPWFFIPFLLWVVTGGVLLATYSRRHLFETVNARHSETLDTVMSSITHFGNGTAIIAILLLLVAAPRLRNWWYAIAAVACNALPALAIQVLKGIFNAPRPFEYFKNDPSWIHFSTAWGDVLYHHSFPSGHSGGAFSLYCFLALLLPPRLRWLGLPLLLFALAVGYSRLYLAAHFFADVYVGSIVGTVVTTALFWVMKHYLYRFYGPNESQMSIHEN